MGKHKKVNIGDRFGKLVVVKYNGVRKKPSDGIFFDGYKLTLKNEMEANMENGLYTANEVAEIIADLFGDTCACNFNDIDEWLPFKCELLDACPNPCGVTCWEQYLKYRHCKNEMEAKGE